MMNTHFNPDPIVSLDEALVVLREESVDDDINGYAYNLFGKELSHVAQKNEEWPQYDNY